MTEFSGGYEMHPRVLELRTLSAECLAFRNLTYKMFDSLFREINEIYMNYERMKNEGRSLFEEYKLLTEFVKLSDKKGDYEKYRQTGQVD